VHVREGKVVKTSLADVPDQCYKRACLRGLSHVQVLYSPLRNKYPLKRAGERGSGEWEQISWDQAVEEISGKLNEVREAYGPRGNAAMSNGGNVAVLSGTFGAQRFKNAMEMQSIGNCVDFGCMPGLTRVYGAGGSYGKSAESSDLENAELFVLWGMNLTVTNWDRWQHMMRAIDKGAKLVVIDPNYTPIASKADLFVPIRPASDAALLMAMINLMITEKRYDEDFVLKATVAPFLVRDDTGKFVRRSDLGIPPDEGPVNPTTGQPTTIDPYVVWDEATRQPLPLEEAAKPALKGAYTANGIKAQTAFDLLAKRASEFSLEYAAEQTEVPVETIRDLVAMETDGRTVANLLGFGTNGYDNSPYMGHAFATMVVLAGQIGKPGTNACYNQEPAPINTFNPLYLFPDMKNIATPSITLLDLPELMEKGTATINGSEQTAPKTLWISHINPYNNFLNPQTWREKVLPGLEMVVVVDRIMSDSAYYMADYVLPAAHYFEQTDVRHALVSAPYAVYAEKAVEPAFEAKSDLEIFRAFAKPLGIEQYFDKPDEELLAECLTYEGCPTIEQLKSERVYRFTEPGWQPYSIEADNITTASKRFEFYSEAPIGQTGAPLPPELFEDNCLPTFKLPLEAWPDVEGADEYPFPLISERDRVMLHSQFSDSSWLLEIDPEPTVRMNPLDAEPRGLKTGDYVRLYNDRGYGVVKLIVSEGQHPGSLTWPKGWQQRSYKDGNLHNLTLLAYNPVTVNHSYTDCHVNIEKVEA
jgi:molybdopterin-containing oxidoreductase family molybdopterin binding subunit